ncbi:Thioesterase/thiol ester dehydrase-isomerase [Parathielavia appendiculata]|uniref:Thioesterase/thiol ester dehydrase-isomerase n=1 Tax=Parathielavia appendiculata TaxID=2587402 RepID=A0AAN6U064_9PEZI|nr:Thioesterase/thiol ester dehydrase-isomerase [Parathielavia appendiculata]
MAAQDQTTPPTGNPSQLESDQATLAHITQYHLTRCTSSPIYAFVLGDATNPLIRFTSARKGIFTARLRLAPQHLNSSGSIHGGVSATLVDWAGGLAIAAWDLRGSTGVSVDINISYLSGARLGDEVEVEGRVEKVGGSLAFTEVRVFKIDEATGSRGAVVATGRHTKFVREKK